MPVPAAQPQRAGAAIPRLPELQWGNGDIIRVLSPSSALLADPALPEPLIHFHSLTHLEPGEEWKLSASLLCFYFSKSFPCPALSLGCELITKSIQPLLTDVKGTGSAKFTPSSSISITSSPTLSQRGSGNAHRPHKSFVDTGIIHQHNCP